MLSTHLEEQEKYIGLHVYLAEFTNSTQHTNHVHVHAIPTHGREDITM